MCFGRPDTSGDQDAVVDLLTDAAGHGGVPSAPIDVSTAMVESQAEALNDLAGAMNEVAKGIGGEQMDMEKIEKAGQVDKTLVDGVVDGLADAGKSILKGIWEFVTGP